MNRNHTREYEEYKKDLLQNSLCGDGLRFKFAFCNEIALVSYLQANSLFEWFLNAMIDGLN